MKATTKVTINFLAKEWAQKSDKEEVRIGWKYEWKKEMKTNVSVRAGAGRQCREDTAICWPQKCLQFGVAWKVLGIMNGIVIYYRYISADQTRKKNKSCCSNLNMYQPICIVLFSSWTKSVVGVICGTHKISCVIYYPETIMHWVRYESIIN